MGKLIAKTAGATLAVIVALLLLFIGLCSLCFPSVMVSLADSMGLERAAAAYSVRVYEQSGDVADLAELVERSYYAENYSAAAEYGERLLADEDFAAYCTQKDAESAGDANIELGYDEYMERLVESARQLAAEGGQQSA